MLSQNDFNLFLSMINKALEQREQALTKENVFFETVYDLTEEKDFQQDLRKERQAPWVMEQTQKEAYEREIVARDEAYAELLDKFYILQEQHEDLLEDYEDLYKNYVSGEY
jgi:hypothetical protein